ncbi:hypothetical protein KQI84_13190 [bacterium]|nr:hypothetical protein [bacterium]
MRTLRCLSGCFIVTLLCLAAPSLGQDLGAVLTPEQYQALPEDSVTYYNRAMERADRIDYQGAVDDMAHAAELAPNHIELQFLLEKWSRYMAEITYGEDSLKNYDYAETALRRLLANSSLGPEERARALRESQKVSESKNSLRARDEQRLKDGLSLVMDIHDMRLESSSASDAGAKKLLEQSLDRKQTEKEQTEVYPWARITGEMGPGSSAGAAVAGAAANAAGAGVADPFADPGAGGAPIADDPFAGGGFGGDGGGFDPFATNNAPAAAPAAPRRAQPRQQQQPQSSPYGNAGDYDPYV